MTVTLNLKTPRLCLQALESLGEQISKLVEVQHFGAREGNGGGGGWQDAGSSTS